MNSEESLAVHVARADAPNRDSHSCAVVFAHGLGSRGDGLKGLALEESLTKKGHDFVRFDFRGHGESDGSMGDLTLSRMIEDLACVVEYVRNIQESYPRIVLVGSSLGAIASAWYHAKLDSDVVAMAMVAPALGVPGSFLGTLNEETRERFWRDGSLPIEGLGFPFDLTRAAIMDSQQYDEGRLAQQIVAPTMVVHGTEDLRIPHRNSREFVRACGSNVRGRWIEGGDHHLRDHRDRLGEWIDDFTRKLT